MLGIEFVDGTRFVRSADGHVYRLLDLTEMQEAQPFPPDSRLAVELSKPNSCRSIMAQPWLPVGYHFLRYVEIKSRYNLSAPTGLIW